MENNYNNKKHVKQAQDDVLVWSPTQSNLKCKCPTQTTVKPENQAGAFEKTC